MKKYPNLFGSQKAGNEFSGVYCLVNELGIKVGMSYGCCESRAKEQIIPGVKIAWVKRCKNAEQVEDGIHQFMLKNGKQFRGEWFLKNGIDEIRLKEIAEQIAI